jgi:uncharacterized protein
LLVNGHAVSPVDVADTRADRRKGLLGQHTIEVPMWFPKTRSVHTIGMSTSIDVVQIAATGKVVSALTMVPGRVGFPCWRSTTTLELSPGQAQALGITVGDTTIEIAS